MLRLDTRRGPVRRLPLDRLCSKRPRPTAGTLSTRKPEEENSLEDEEELALRLLNQR